MFMNSSPPSDGLSVAQRFSYNYAVRPDRFKDRDLAAKFLLNDRDGATYEFLQGCEEKTSGFCMLLVNSCLQVSDECACHPQGCVCVCVCVDHDEKFDSTLHIKHGTELIQRLTVKGQVTSSGPQCTLYRVAFFLSLMYD